MEHPLSTNPHKLLGKLLLSANYPLADPPSPDVFKYRSKPERLRHRLLIEQEVERRFYCRLPF